jgi:hypothetical protein
VNARDLPSLDGSDTPGGRSHAARLRELRGGNEAARGHSAEFRLCSSGGLVNWPRTQVRNGAGFLKPQHRRTRQFARWSVVPRGRRARPSPAAGGPRGRSLRPSPAPPQPLPRPFAAAPTAVRRGRPSPPTGRPLQGRQNGRG